MLMKLKYNYRVETWAEDRNYDPSQSQKLCYESYGVDLLIELVYDEARQVFGIVVYVPGVQLPRNEEGNLYLPSFPEETARAYEAASFLIDLLHYQTGRGVLLEWPNGPDDYLSETPEERDFREKLVIANFKIPYSSGVLRGPYNLSPPTVQRYSQVRAALSIYTSAARLSDPISKFREFYRILERFFDPKDKRFDSRVAEYLGQFRSDVTEDKITALRVLRNKCSHATENFITSGEWRGLNEIRASLVDLQETARLLVENPPPAREAVDRSEASGAAKGED